MNHSSAHPPPESDDIVPPTVLLTPKEQRSPVILTSAHSGRHYPRSFLTTARLDPLALRRSEDTFVDELFDAAPRLGAPLLLARFPRVWCDANREAWELDPTMFTDALPPYVNSASPRVAAGLGTIAKLVSANEPIYRHKLRFADAEARIQTCWMPFHRQLRALVDATLARFGLCVLIDCHSMPSQAAASVPGHPDLVLGDGFGTSCSAAIADQIQAVLEQARFAVRRNEPYAGGYIVRHYGSAAGPTHAVQLELNRVLYMNERQLTRSEGFESLVGQLTDVVSALTRTDWVVLAQKKGRP